MTCELLVWRTVWPGAACTRRPRKGPLHRLTGKRRPWVDPGCHHRRPAEALTRESKAKVHGDPTCPSANANR
jgi:hypothetical protein